jgi:hypothetical protein
VSSLEQRVVRDVSCLFFSDWLLFCLEGRLALPGRGTELSWSSMDADALLQLLLLICCEISASRSVSCASSVSVDCPPVCVAHDLYCAVRLLRDSLPTDELPGRSWRLFRFNPSERCTC